MDRKLPKLPRPMKQFGMSPLIPIYGLIRAELTELGTMIGPNHLMIAAIALAHKLTLVTHNTREFSRVAGLKLEDWQ